MALLADGEQAMRRHGSVFVRMHPLDPPYERLIESFAFFCQQKHGTQRQKKYATRGPTARRIPRAMAPGLCKQKRVARPETRLPFLWDDVILLSKDSRWVAGQGLNGESRKRLWLSLGLIAEEVDYGPASHIVSKLRDGDSVDGGDFKAVGNPIA